MLNLSKLFGYVCYLSFVMSCLVTSENRYILNEFYPPLINIGLLQNCLLFAQCFMLYRETNRLTLKYWSFGWISLGLYYTIYYGFQLFYSIPMLMIAFVCFYKSPSYSMLGLSNDTSFLVSSWILNEFINTICNVHLFGNGNYMYLILIFMELMCIFTNEAGFLIGSIYFFIQLLVNQPDLYYFAIQAIGMTISSYIYFLPHYIPEEEGEVHIELNDYK